jgi:DNA topoisomerase I
MGHGVDPSRPQGRIYIRRRPREDDAIALRLINLGWFRVGSEGHARDSSTYGITTLHKRHVDVRGNRIWLAFPGKQKIEVRRTLVDDELAAALQELIAAPGTRVFRYRREDGLCNLTSERLNDAVVEEYLDERTIEDFRPRHLRVVGARQVELDAEEQALLSLLRSWRIRRARKAA